MQWRNWLENTSHHRREPIKRPCTVQGQWISQFGDCLISPRETPRSNSGHIPVCGLPLVIGVIVVDLLRMTALSFQKGGLLKVPRSPYTPLVRDIHRDKWTNYPVLTEKTKSHNHCLFKAMYDVSLITYDLTWSLFGNEERKFDARFVEKAEGAFARLYEWYSELPNCLEITNAPPHVLSLQFVLCPKIRTMA